MEPYALSARRESAARNNGFQLVDISIQPGEAVAFSS